MRDCIPVLGFLIIAVVFALPAFAHSDRTDANSGHYNRKTGTYYYHSVPKTSTPVQVQVTLESEPQTKSKLEERPRIHHLETSMRLFCEAECQ